MILEARPARNPSATCPPSRAYDQTHDEGLAFGLAAGSTSRSTNTRDTSRGDDCTDVFDPDHRSSTEKRETAAAACTFELRSEGRFKRVE